MTTGRMVPRGHLLTVVCGGKFDDSACSFLGVWCQANFPTYNLHTFICNDRCIKHFLLPQQGSALDALIGELTMKCIHCGRERKIGMARTEKFCTQRCIVNWLELNPNKSVEDVMVTTSRNTPVSIASVQSLSTSTDEETQTDESSKPKPVSRALKNLQIDMALPGTKLSLPVKESDSAEEEGGARKKPRISATPSQPQQFSGIGTRSTRRERVQTSPIRTTRLATPITAKTTRRSAQVKVTPVSGAKSTLGSSTYGNIKRMLSASAPHPPALKKAKTDRSGDGDGTPSKPSTSGSGPKAVTFNLEFVQGAQNSQATPTFSLVPIDQLSAPLGTKKQNMSVSIPDGKVLTTV